MSSEMSVLQNVVIIMDSRYRDKLHLKDAYSEPGKLCIMYSDIILSSDCNNLSEC